MTTATFEGRMVELDQDGFLADPSAWDEGIAVAIAADSSIPLLTQRHWQVVHFMRDAYQRDGAAPSIRSLGKESGVPIKELYELFPKGPAKLAARIAGIPKPRGCI